MGSVIEPNHIGRMAGNDDAQTTLISGYDADTRGVVDFLKYDSSVIADKIGTLGFCMGGYLAFRAPFGNEV